LALISTSSEINDITSLIAMRYLGGILELPTFWREDNRARHQEPAKRLFKKIGSFLEDAGFGSREPLGNLLDPRGIDSLIHAALKGVHIWRTQIPADDLIHQTWAGECLKVVKLLLTSEPIPVSDSHISIADHFDQDQGERYITDGLGTS
jgi:hypothetical protein